MATRQKTRKTILIFTFILFPVVFYFMSPYLVIEGTLQGIVTGSFLFFILLLVSSLVLGRAYCGWVCPASTIQDTIGEINNKKITKRKIIKWIIWVPWILTIILLAIKNGGYNSIDPLFQTFYGISVTNVFSLFIYLMVILLIIVPSLSVGKRSFCHHICWMAPFMIIGRKIAKILHIPSFKLNSIPRNCTSCNLCTKHCPMGLPVTEMIKTDKPEHTDCILCGNCIDICKTKAIKYSWKKPIK